MNQPNSQWYYKRPAVILALILLGPLAFPFLWKSPHFNVLSKIALTVGVTLLTAYLIYGTWQIVGRVIEDFKMAGL